MGQCFAGWWRFSTAVQQGEERGGLNRLRPSHPPLLSGLLDGGHLRSGEDGEGGPSPIRVRSRARGWFGAWPNGCAGADHGGAAHRRASATAALLGL